MRVRSVNGFSNLLKSVFSTISLCGASFHVGKFAPALRLPLHSCGLDLSVAAPCLAPSSLFHVSSFLAFLGDNHPWSMHPWAKELHGFRKTVLPSLLPLPPLWVAQNLLNWALLQFLNLCQSDKEILRGSWFKFFKIFGVCAYVFLFWGGERILISFAHLSSFGLFASGLQ